MISVETGITTLTHIFSPYEVQWVLRNWCHTKKYDLGFDDKLVTDYYKVYGYEITKG
jgi:hypothetical protein